MSQPRSSLAPWLLLGCLLGIACDAFAPRLEDGRTPDRFDPGQPAGSAGGPPIFGVGGVGAFGGTGGLGTGGFGAGGFGTGGFGTGGFGTGGSGTGGFGTGGVDLDADAGLP